MHLFILKDILKSEETKIAGEIWTEEVCINGILKAHHFDTGSFDIRKAQKCLN